MPEKTDVLVIGGGAIGASVAYFVKQLDPGAEVAVVERDPAYTLASTPRAAGGVRRLFSLPENIALSTYSIGFFEDFPAAMAVDGVPADIGLRQNGYLFIVPPPDRDVLRRNFDVQRQLGCRVLWLEPDELKHRFPSMNVADLGAAVLSPDDGWLDPHSVLMGLNNKARSMGTRFLADEVTRLVRQGHRVTAAQLASGRRVEASHVVNAVGAWAKEICALVGVPVPIEPMRRYEHYFQCQDPIDPSPTSRTPGGWRSAPKGRATPEACPPWPNRAATPSTSTAPTSRTPCGPSSRTGSRSSSGPGACAPCPACTTRTTSTATSSSAPEPAASATSTWSPDSPAMASCTRPAAAGPWPNSW